jgi:hypothetical protein
VGIDQASAEASEAGREIVETKGEAGRETVKTKREASRQAEPSSQTDPISTVYRLIFSFACW